MLRFELRRLRRLLLALGLAFSCAGLPQNAGAWNALGHMVVAQIAYESLTPKTKAVVDHLLSVPVEPVAALARTNTFVTASVWADDTKQILGTGVWHYVDIPFSLDGTEIHFTPPEMDVVKAIEKAKATLRDPKSTDMQKAEMLRYLIHFVGDIQQPLHCTTAISAAHPQGDKGGNDFAVQGVPGARNLHALWDDGLGLFTGNAQRPLDDAGTSHVLTLAHDITTLHPAAMMEGKSMETQDWANDGFEKAKTVTYAGIEPGTTPSKQYTEKGQQLVKERIALGGYRLSMLLNGIFDAPTTATLTAAATAGRYSKD